MGGDPLEGLVLGEKHRARIERALGDVRIGSGNRHALRPQSCPERAHAEPVIEIGRTGRQIPKQALELALVAGAELPVRGVPQGLARRVPTALAVPARDAITPWGRTQSMLAARRGACRQSSRSAGAVTSGPPA